MSRDWINSIKAVGFDLDGTLYRTTPELNAWFARELIAKVHDKIGGNVDEIKIEYERRREEKGSNTLTLNSFGLDGEKVFQNLFDEVNLGDFVIPDGRLAKIIKRLTKKYKVFLISNGTERQVLRKLKYIEIDKNLFRPLISCYDVDGWVKPNPPAFLAAMEELKLSPEECLYVGDRNETDIEGARSVGMKTCIVWNKSKIADIELATVYDLEGLLI